MVILIGNQIRCKFINWMKNVRSRIQTRDLFVEADNALPSEMLRTNRVVLIDPANLADYYNIWSDI